jgi:tetratricopeptide (TPR) repeat protein
MADVDLNEKIGAFLASAYKKFMVRDFDSAIHELKAAEVIDRDNPEILYNLGVNYCRLGLYKTAVGYFIKMLNLEYAFIDSLEVKKLLAYALIHVNEYMKSERYVDQVLQYASHDVAALNLKGYCRDMQGDHAGALKAYRAVLGAEKDNVNAINSISYITAKSGGDLELALRLARLAHESNPGSPAYCDTLGYVHMKIGNVEQAEKFLKEAYRKLPMSEEIKEHLRELTTLKNSTR